MTQISRPRRAPKYELLAETLTERIAAMMPHQVLPTERELTKEFGVSRMTVRQAIARLVTQGLVYNIQGSGTYVAHPDVVAKTLRLTSFSEDMRQRGLVPASRILAHGAVAASGDIARHLDVPAGQELVAIRRLRLADDKPMALESVLIRSDIADWSRISVWDSLYEQLAAQGVLVTRATQSVDAVNLDHTQARHLDQAVGAAALRVTRVSYSDRGLAVEHAETIYRADRYSFEIVVSREGR